MQELGKLDSPSASPVDWRKVVELGDQILSERSKDLQIAAYFAFALQQTQGLDGLLAGIALLAGMLQDYWETLFPDIKRLRGRVAALSWFIGKSAMAVPGLSLAPADREKALELEALSKYLAQLAREKLQANAPGFGSLLDAIARQLASLPPPAPTLPASPAGPASAPAPAQVPVSSSSPASAPGLVPPPAAPVASPAPPTTLGTSSIAAFAGGIDPIDFLLGVGSALVAASSKVRQANPVDPAAYLMLRQGTWMHLTKAPPIDGTGRTRERPMPQRLKQQFDGMIAEEAWQTLLEKAEYVVANCPLLLDPHRYSALALAAMGEKGKPARQVVIILLGTLLKRFPELLDALASDKSPLADERTKEWIRQEVLSDVGLPKGKEQSEASEEDAVIKESKTQAGSGNLPAALSALAKAGEKTRDPRSWFRLRLAMADLCRQQGQWDTARGIYESLDREILRRGLDDWEPLLARPCVEGLLVSLQQQVKNNRNIQVDQTRFSSLYDRLCLLDPAAALRIVGRAQG